jgi:SAM-dependent methyltransferase
MQNPQKKHFEDIHDNYINHYNDKYSNIYKNKFIYNKFFKDINLNNKKIIELACGNGENTKYMQTLAVNCSFYGCDISSSACKDYELNTRSLSIQADITSPWEGPKDFDYVFIFGGVHHCLNNIDQLFKNIDKLLKIDGEVIMIEPNSKFILEPIRKFWYSGDKKMFSENEGALDPNEIIKNCKNNFQLVDISYVGGPAFFFILQSMILRVPFRIKSIYSPLLLHIEKIYEYLFSNEKMFNSFILKLRKK